MDKINVLTSVLEGGVAPDNYDGKVVNKLVKAWKKLENPRVVKLYPIRRVAHEDSRYCVYACPFKGSEIDEQTLQAITSLVDQLEVGEIRYDSMMSSGTYFALTENGTHILDDEYRDSIVEISDRFDDIVLFSDMVTSPKKVSQLDCHHAIIGLEEQPNQYNVVAIPNSVIGEATNRQSFKVDLHEEEPTSPAQEKVKSALMTVSAIITIGILIWYFLFR